MSIIVVLDDLDTVVDEGSVIQVTGTDQETSERVTFAGDWRPMNDLLQEVMYQGQAEAYVEEWQVLDRHGYTVVTDKSTGGEK